MKKATTTFLLSLLFSAAFAQTWAPIGATWTYSIGDAWSNNNYFNSWVSVKDSLVEGHDCKVIKRNFSAVCTDISGSLITYEDSNKIYWHNPIIGQFTVLYDFNKNTGESWTIMLDSSCSVDINVDSTGMDTINGIALKIQYISCPDFVYYPDFINHGKIIQNIGNIIIPGVNPNFHCHSIIYDDNTYLGLRCYEDSIIGFHDFGIAPSCDWTNVGIEEKEDESFVRIFPNPASDKIYIDKPDGLKISEFMISSIHSETLYTSSFVNRNSIDISFLAPGIYFLRIKTEKDSKVTMIIKN
jgi:hypothetical protein